MPTERKWRAHTKNIHMYMSLSLAQTQPMGTAAKPWRNTMAKQRGINERQYLSSRSHHHTERWFISEKNNAEHTINTNYVAQCTNLEINRQPVRFPLKTQRQTHRLSQGHDFRGLCWSLPRFPQILIKKTVECCREKTFTIVLRRVVCVCVGGGDLCKFWYQFESWCA